MLDRIINIPGVEASNLFTAEAEASKEPMRHRYKQYGLLCDLGFGVRYLPYGNGCNEHPNCFECPEPDCQWKSCNKSKYGGRALANPL